MRANKIWSYFCIETPPPNICIDHTLLMEYDHKKENISPFWGLLGERTWSVMFLHF